MSRNYIKGVTERFGFDVFELRNFRTNIQKQSNGNALWDVYKQPPLATFDSSHNGYVYTHQRGAFVVARFEY